MKTSTNVPTADDIARKATCVEDVSPYFTNEFAVVKPVRHATTNVPASMKYFTYERIAAANNWIEQSKEMCLDAVERFEEVVKQYDVSLQQLKPRISRQAWHFFANGYGRWGLHDGRLLSLSI